MAPFSLISRILLVAIIGISSVSALAQEMERRVEPKPPPKHSNEINWNDWNGGTSSTAPNKPGSLLPKSSRLPDGVKLGQPNLFDGTMPPTGLETRHVHWNRSFDPTFGTVYSAFGIDEDGKTPKLLDQTGLENFYDSSKTIVNSGDVPNGKKWRELTESRSDRTVIHDPLSANHTWEEILGATALAERPLNPARTKVFNALPQETDPALSMRERERMQIGGTREAWRQVNERIGAAADGFASEVATREALLNELQYGDHDVIVIYAHFDGTRLLMPGADGSAISMGELASLNRIKDPRVRNRVIVLASCNAAALTLGRRSLASVLLEQGIARTVMATDQPYDARSIPDLMARLRAGVPLRSADGNLRQHTELKLCVECVPMRMRHESETVPGE